MTSVTVHNLEDYRRAELEAAHSPVLLQHDGEPELILLPLREYNRLLRKDGDSPVGAPAAPGRSLVHSLAVPESDYFDWDPPRLQLSLSPMDFA